MAWIDVVVVNRDAFDEDGEFRSMSASEERPLPDVELQNQGRTQDFRRALRDLAFYRLGEVNLDASLGRVGSTASLLHARENPSKTSRKGCETRGLVLSLRPTSCSRLDLACQDEDGSSHASFDQLSWR